MQNTTADIQQSNPSLYWTDGPYLRVFPYYYAYETHFKKRWEGRSVLSVFSSEFPHFSELYYKQGIEQGKILVNGKKVNEDYIVVAGDKLSHIVHRHEMPVFSKEIHILSDQNELLAVEKPAGLPIHPCGQYRYNCLLAHLVAFKNIRSVYPTHRLDTGTSGVVVFARSPQMARNMNTLFETQKIHKQYLAHVRDPRFLLGDTLIDHKAPIGIISHKPKLCGCGGESQKSSRTLFKAILRVGEDVVVQCWPMTGRTHQIRVHLQNIGTPIVGDGLYGCDQQNGVVVDEDDDSGEACLILSSLPSGKREVEQGDDEKSVKKARLGTSLENPCQSLSTFPPISESNVPQPSLTDSDVLNSAPQITSIDSSSSPSHSSMSTPHTLVDGAPAVSGCPVCQKLQQSATPLLTKPIPQLRLHAFRYQGPNFLVSSALPEWAIDLGITDSHIISQDPLLLLSKEKTMSN